MNITVYCASAMGEDPAYRQAAEAVGEWIAENGHRLVYGCLLYTSYRGSFQRCESGQLL